MILHNVPTLFSKLAACRRSLLAMAWSYIAFKSIKLYNQTYVTVKNSSLSL